MPSLWPSPTLLVSNPNDDEARMRILRIAVIFSLLSFAGCATSGSQEAAARPTATACNTLDPSLREGDVFAAPLTVVETERTYRYVGRAQLKVPEGVALSVHAPGMSRPDVHRVVACRLDRGPETRVGVTTRGSVYRVTIESSEPSVARSIQEAHTPEG